MRPRTTAENVSIDGRPDAPSSVEAVEHFPGSNPHPVLRVDAEGRLEYANPSSASVVAALEATVGERLPDAWLARFDAATTSGEPVELRIGTRTVELLAVSVSDLGFMNVYGTDVTAARLVDKFPDLNPSPVLRISEAGEVTYANAASRELRDALGVEVGTMLPADLARELFAALDDGAPGPVDQVADHRTYRLTPVRIPELGLINVYGADVTAAKAIAHFPDQNPNPVFRLDWDGVLVYANPASADLLDGLGAAVGGHLPDAIARSILGAVRQADRGTIEVVSHDRAYALLAVDVPEFGFINVYGTDVTHVREIEELGRENERLLLALLPEPIAERLRRGERLIADRFEDVTLMFADIVGFTELSSGMDPDELVTVLNDVFTVFDRLVDQAGLEKVKTIGDAYMVVGGLPDVGGDHAGRVARLALAVGEQVDGIAACRRLGIKFRIGVHSGPVIAGVIGEKKFIYDVWGDTVNVASRMESTGLPGRIQVSEALQLRLRDRFRFEARGTIDVKGKGLMPTYFLVGESG